MPVSRAKKAERALEFFSGDARLRPVPNDTTYSALTIAVRALDLFQEMRDQSMVLNGITYNA